jgi:hypothetical protein
MKIRYAAMLSAASLLIAGLYTAAVMRKGLRIATVLLPRQVWIMDNTGSWSLGVWLWLLALFGWMVLLVTLMWSYLPGYRVSSMLQSGLITISAVLAVTGLVSWMAATPYAARLDQASFLMPLIDAFVLGLLGAALFMGGAVTAWIGWDLSRLDTLNVYWGVPAIAAGLLATLSPFALPMPWHLVISGILWLAWCLFLISRKEIPNAYSEWK